MRQKLTVLFATLVAIQMLSIACFGQPSGGGRLAGTWDATITIVNCDTGDAITSFQSTASFNQGGTFTGITSGTPPANRTPEIGVWRHDTGRNYNFRFKAYLFNPAGAAIAYQIVTHSLELSNDNTSYISSGGVKIFAMNGAPVGSGCSKGEGTRFVLD
jgi:hypothetical protein